MLELEEVLGYALRLGAEYAEARLQMGESTGYIVKNGEQEPIKLSVDYGLGVRLIVAGSLGFASTNILEKKKVREAIDAAFKMASASRRLSKKVEFSPEKVERGRWGVSEKDRIDNVSIEDRLQLLFDVEEGLSLENVLVRLPSRFLSLSLRREYKRYLNSEGTSIESSLPRMSFFAFLTASEGGKGVVQRALHLGGTGGGEVVEGWEVVERAIEEAKVLGKLLKRWKKPPRGVVDLVVGPEVTGIICHESCGHPQEADRILGREAAQAGESYVTEDMIGYKVGSEDVTILDDPTIPGSYGYYLYDDEGVRAGERMLIEVGRIMNFLHNRETAGAMGVPSNGAARASFYGGEPIVRMANTYLQPGDLSVQELVEDVDRGVYMKSFMEWNIDDRRYNQRYVGLEAYLIEHGEIGDPVKNPVLEVTTPGLYGSVEGVGDDLEFEAAICGKGDPMQSAPVWHGGPTIRLRKIRLGG